MELPLEMTQKVEMVQKVITKLLDEYPILAKKNNKLLHLLPASWARFKILTINFKVLCATDNEDRVMQSRSLEGIC